MSPTVCLCLSLVSPQAFRSIDFELQKNSDAAASSATALEGIGIKFLDKGRGLLKASVSFCLGGSSCCCLHCCCSFGCCCCCLLDDSLSCMLCPLCLSLHVVVSFWSSRSSARVPLHLCVSSLPLCLLLSLHFVCHVGLLYCLRLFLSLPCLTLYSCQSHCRHSLVPSPSPLTLFAFTNPSSSVCLSVAPPSVPLNLHEGICWVSISMCLSFNLRVSGHVALSIRWQEGSLPISLSG